MRDEAVMKIPLLGNIALLFLLLFIFANCAMSPGHIVPGTQIGTSSTVEAGLPALQSRAIQTGTQLRIGNTVEAVVVLKVMDSEYKAIIQRRNGEMYLIEYGVGVISNWRYENKAVLIHSPGIFCGVGSFIILPDDDQKARIWNAEQIRH